MILRASSLRSALTWQAVLLLAIFLLPAVLQSTPHSAHSILHRRESTEMPQEAAILLNATSNALTTLEPFADAVVWEGQHDDMRIQLDPTTFERAPSLTGDTTATTAPITYHAMLDNATALPPWITFDHTRLLLSGVPALGTYNRSTTLTVRVEASSVPGFIQATLHFTIRVLKHSLALSTSPRRACSSAALYTSYSEPNEDSSWQEYLPDINLGPEQRKVNLVLSMDLFRIDGCTQPAGLGLFRASDDSSIVNSHINTTGISNGQSHESPTLASLTVVLSVDTMQALGRADNSLPEWLVFDEEQGTLEGVVPLEVPARMVLEFDIIDSFDSTTKIRLQIFSHPAAVPLFIFTQPVPDLWIKSNETFHIQPIAAIAASNADPAWFPIESRFFFQPTHPADVAPMLQQQQTSAVSRDIQDHTASPSFVSAPESKSSSSSSNNNSSSLCTYRDLWGIEDNVGQQAPFLSWFNQTSATRQLPSNNSTMAFEGLIPCEVVVQVRWIARNTIGQWTSTEFRIWASHLGPPVPNESPLHPDTDSTARKKAAGSLAIKILVALAVAVPLSLALWFLASRYFWLCNKDRGQQDDKLGAQGDVEYGQRSRVSSGVDYEDATWEPRPDRRGPLIADLAASRELGYRSSHEDDPSVGHHDSYSDKYVAEHGPPRAHSNASEGEGSGSRKRLSFLGWLFRQKQAGLPGSDREGSTISITDPPRGQGSGGASPFSLKRISVGSPFESKRFGFVNGSRMSAYDSASEGASAVDMSERKKRPHSCRSAASTVTGYTAGMSDQSSAIDGGQQETEQHIKCSEDLNSQKHDMTEVEGGPEKLFTTRSGLRAACNQADQNARLSRVPSLFLLDPGLFDTDDSELDSPEQTDEEQDGLKVRKLQTPERALIVSRSDSGALMSTPSSAVSLHHLQETLLRQPLSISTTCLGSSSASSSKTDLSTNSLPHDHLLSTSSTSLSLPAPTTPMPENIFAKDRQLSMHASPGSLQRRSIVELLQSNDTPVSPLSAFSASLPSWGHAVGEANRHGKDYLPEQPRGQTDMLAMENGREGVFEQEQEQGFSGVSVHAMAGTVQETAKWMVVPSTQAIRSVSIRKAGSDSNDDSEWISQLLEEGISDDDDDDREDDEKSDVVGESCFRNSLSDDKCKDQRHLSLKSELGIIEQAATEPESRAEDRDYGTTPVIQGSDLKVAIAASQPGAHDQNASHDEVGCNEEADVVIALQSTSSAVPIDREDHGSSSSGGSSGSSGSSPQPTHSVVFTRPSDIRVRPTSYPGRTPVRAPDAGVPHRFVKATVGTAFHYTAIARGPPVVGPSSANQSSSQRLSLPTLSPVPSTLSSVAVEIDAKQQAEYRAYLVSDPQDSCRTPLAEAAPNSTVASDSISPMDMDQERRKLPHWIQFNSRMRSLWGRPIPGTAGEWQISLVQSIPRPPSIPLPPLPPLSHSPHPPPISQAELTDEQRIELVRLLVRDASDGSPLSP